MIFAPKLCSFSFPYRSSINTALVCDARYVIFSVSIFISIYSLELEKINQCDLNVFSTALDSKELDVRVLTNCLKVNYYYGYFVMLNIALPLVSRTFINGRQKCCFFILTFIFLTSLILLKCSSEHETYSC